MRSYANFGCRQMHQRRRLDLTLSMLIDLVTNQSYLPHYEYLILIDCFIIEDRTCTK